MPSLTNVILGDALICTEHYTILSDEVVII